MHMQPRSDAAGLAEQESLQLADSLLNGDAKELCHLICLPRLLGMLLAFEAVLCEMAGPVN